MDRPSERRAFARAWSYLNYHAVAKWTALFAAVAAGVLYVLLLIVLWLFGDLMVHRGQIPGYENLSPGEARTFDDRWETHGGEAMEFLGLSKARGDKNLAFVRPSDTALSSQEQRFIWRAYLVRLMRGRVGGAAAMQVLPTYRDLPDAEKQAVVQNWMAIPEPDRQSLLAQFAFGDARRAKLLNAEPGEQEVVWNLYLYREFGQFESAAEVQAADILRDRLLALAGAGDEATLPDEHPLDDHGILSLVIRTHLHDRYYAGVVDFLARYSPWLWKTRSDRWGNSIYYLAALFIVAIVLAILWALTIYLTREMAARAVIEATTRLRRAVYHHTFRLGTLAFRALGPSEAVTVFTRHVEAVSEGLYNWITVTFREPVKFGLLLAFALIVNWKLALAFLLFAALVWLIGGQIVVHFRREGRAAT
ncbi:MAG TPA: ABC transporter transmembrane domain-containing protein, partial [Gemmataceae bacterium]|nr:ABC transporter transmembrane domain-containing protein [Gemmataceae bacterium]